MEIRCPICDQPVSNYASDEFNGVLHSESYECTQHTHHYTYEFMTGGAREHIQTHSLDLTAISHYTDTLEVSRVRQATLKQAVLLAQKEHALDKPVDVHGKD